jgi:hypothetical protein
MPLAAAVPRLAVHEALGAPSLPFLKIMAGSRKISA